MPCSHGYAHYLMIDHCCLLSDNLNMYAKVLTVCCVLHRVDLSLLSFAQDQHWDRKLVHQLS